MSHMNKTDEMGILLLGLICFVLPVTGVLAGFIGYHVAPPVWAGVLAGFGSWLGILMVCICLK